MGPVINNEYLLLLSYVEDVVVESLPTLVMSARSTVVPPTLTYVLLPEIVTDSTVPVPVTALPDVSVVAYVACCPIILNAAELLIEVFMSDNADNELI